MPSRDPRPRRGATTAQLRAAIDSGWTRDKTAAPDPAAAPLGTPPSPELVEQMLRQELRDVPQGEAGQVAKSPDAAPRRQPHGRRR
jgi:hypothetical protein